MIGMLVAKSEGKAIDENAYQARLPGAVKEIVQKQIELGLDVIDDGEYSKPSFVTYVNDRLGGFEPDPNAPRRGSWAESREGLAFPEFYASAPARNIRMVCTGPVTYRGQALVQREIANLKAAIGGAKVEAFMPAISVANIEDWMLNRYYKTPEEYLFAIAEAMREEYKAIVDAGFLVQIDDPRLVSYYLVIPAPRLRNAASGPSSASKRSITPCAEFPPKRFVTTPATASTLGRGCTTWRSSTSSTSF